MTRYSRGDITLVNIAFSGAIGYKRRPAVVLSVTTFNTAGSKLIVVAVTSNISSPFRPGDTLLNNWKAAGLLKPSAVRGVVATIDEADIERKLGKLSEKDFIAVEKNIANILGFRVVRRKNK